MNNMEKKLDTFIDEVRDSRKLDFEQHDKIFTAITMIQLTIAEIPKKLQDENDNRYSMKWAEKAWIYVFSIVGGSLLLALLGSIIIQRGEAFF
jgi:hypothetical protein